MGKPRQSTYGKRKGPEDEYHNTRDEHPYRHSKQKITCAGRHLDSKPDYDCHPNITCSEHFHQSRRRSYQASVLNNQNYAGGGISDPGYGPNASIPRRFKDIRDHRYNRCIRDVLRQGFVLKQKLQQLLDSLAWRRQIRVRWNGRVPIKPISSRRSPRIVTEISKMKRTGEVPICLPLRMRCKEERIWKGG